MVEKNYNASKLNAYTKYPLNFVSLNKSSKTKPLSKSLQGILQGVCSAG